MLYLKSLVLSFYVLDAQILTSVRSWGGFFYVAFFEIS